LIKTAISDQASALYSVDITDEDAVSALWSVADSTSDWVHQRVLIGSSNQAPGGAAQVSERSLTWSGIDSWEEMVWCPVLGIKGQVDLVLKATEHVASLTGKGEGREVFLPVELKTGKWRPNGLIGHRAQV
jgi:hypothetical protein